MNNDYSALSSGKLKISRGALLSLAAPIFVGLCVVRFLPYGEGLSSVVGIIIIILGGIFLVLSASKSRHPLGVLAIVGIVFFAYLISASFGNNPVEFTLLFFLSHAGFAWAIVLSPSPGAFARYACHFVLLGFLLLIVSGADPNSVFSISRNYISVLVVLSVSIYLYQCDRANRDPSSLILLLALVILVWAVGRAGILAGVLFLVGSTLKSIRSMAYTFASLGTVGLVALATTDYLSLYLEAANDTFDRIDRLSGDSERIYMNSEYLTAATQSTKNILLGVELRSVWSISQVGGNPHNSFIRLHAFFGLLGVLAVLIFSTFAIIRLLLRGRKLILLAGTVSMFRAFFDIAAFHGPLDVPILMMIFHAISKTTELSTVVKSKDRERVTK